MKKKIGALDYNWKDYYTNTMELFYHHNNHKIVEVKYHSQQCCAVPSSTN